MDNFEYRNGTLFAENVSIEKIAGQVGTPVYIYSKATFKNHLLKIQQAFYYLAVIANSSGVSSEQSHNGISLRYNFSSKGNIK